MATKHEHRPSLHVAITSEQYFALQRLPHGTKKALFGVLIDQVLDIMATDGLSPLIKLAEGKSEIKIIDKE